MRSWFKIYSWRKEAFTFTRLFAANAWSVTFSSAGTAGCGEVWAGSSELVWEEEGEDEAQGTEEDKVGEEEDEKEGKDDDGGEVEE